MVPDFLTSLESRAQGGSPPVTPVTVHPRRPSADQASGVCIRGHPAAAAHRSVVDPKGSFDVLNCRHSAKPSLGVYIAIAGPEFWAQGQWSQVLKREGERRGRGSARPKTE